MVKLTFLTDLFMFKINKYLPIIISLQMLTIKLSICLWIILFELLCSSNGGLLAVSLIASVFINQYSVRAVITEDKIHLLFICAITYYNMDS